MNHKAMLKNICRDLKIDDQIVDTEGPVHASGEIRDMFAVVQGMISDVLQGLENGDLDHARHALEKEDRLNEMQIALRGSHVDRLNAGTCDMLAGLIFLDLVDYLEKIGDHLANIAQGLLGGLRWGEKHGAKSPVMQP